MANNAQQQTEQRIIRDPEILAGKPVVKGTRISVELVLEYLASNPNFDELFADYPRLTMDDVKACLAFAQETVVKSRSAKRRPRTDLPATAAGM